MRRLPLLVALLLIAGCGRGEPPARRIVLIVCDTLSARHLDGPDAAQTDLFDELAGRGVLFTHCTTPQVWTLSAHATLFTGLEPGVHRVGAATALAPSIAPLAERLADAGFANGGFYTSNGWLDPDFGFGRGFAAYREFELTDDLEGAAAAWADTAWAVPATPGFAFLHFMDVHSRTTLWPYPYAPRKSVRVRRDPRRPPTKLVTHVTDPGKTESREEWNWDAYDPGFLANAYDRCVEDWDRFRLRALVDGILARPDMADALVIITADHGEAFQEHGHWEHISPHAETREVPLLVIWPGRLPAGVVVDERVSLTDLTPTILDLAGLKANPEAQGVSLRPALEGNGPLPVRDFLIDGFKRGMSLDETALVGEVGGTWYSLVAKTDTTGCTGSFQSEAIVDVAALHDLSSDPAETTEVGGDHPAVVTEMLRRLESRLAANAELARHLGTGRAGDAIELSEDEKAQLRALGY